jgi:hypothetical protein
MDTRFVRLALGAGAALLLAGAAPDETRLALPSTPPRSQRAAGEVLFSDDFASGKLGAWAPDRPGVWSVVRGMLRADLPDQKQLRSLIYAGDTSWTDLAVDVDVCMMRGVDKGVVVRVHEDSGIGVDLRGGGYQDVLMYHREWPLGRVSATNANGVWHHIRVEARGSRFRVFVNGELKLDRPDVKNARPTGAIALPAYTGGSARCTVYYDNIVVTALKATGTAVQTPESN